MSVPLLTTRAGPSSGGGLPSTSFVWDTDFAVWDTDFAVWG